MSSAQMTPGFSRPATPMPALLLLELTLPVLRRRALASTPPPHDHPGAIHTEDI